MNTILTSLIDNASELAVFFITATAAWIKRRYDLKKIKESNDIAEYFRRAK